MRMMLVMGCLIAALLSGAARADSTEFVGEWVTAKEGGFLSTLTGPDKDNGEIARVVVTAAGVTALRIHLYGRCDPECDWGSQLGHARSAAPDSKEVESLSADFSTGKSIKHLTLRRGPGGTLHFLVATDFTDHSGNQDYDAGGTLRRAPASAPPAVPGAAAPALLASSDVPEDCEKINPEDVYVAPKKRGWAVNDFDHTIVDFGPDKVGAVKASRVLAYYRFDEHCFITRSQPKMVYWRTAGQIPRDAMPGEDCIAVHPQSIAVKDSRVMDGDRVVVDFVGDAGAAAQAASVIRSYRLNRQCYAARPSEKMIYWLSQ